MADIGVWDETTPTAASRATDADDVLRSDFSAMAVGLGTSWFWPGSADSGGDSDSSGGETRLGTARMARGPARASTTSDGFLSIDTGENHGSSLRHTGDSGTFMVGHANGIEELTSDATPAERWLMQQGEHTFSDALIATEDITFVTAYLAAPAVTASSSNNSVNWGVHHIISSGFSSRFSYIGPGSVTQTPTIYWTAMGLVNL